MFGPVILPLDQAVSAVASPERLAQAGVASEQTRVITQVHRFAVGRDAAGAVVLGHSSHSSHASHASHSSSSGGGIGWPSPVTPVFPGVPVAPVVLLPTAPDSVVTTAGDGAASLSWAAVYAGGASVTYRITASPGGGVRTVVDGTSAEFDGLTNGTPYSFVVAATTSAGEGPGTQTRTVTPLAPQIEAESPVIVGEPAAGRLLRVETPGWASGTTFTYQWRAGGVDVPGAVGRTFRPTVGLVGRRVTVVVEGENSAYANGASASSAKTLKIARIGHLALVGARRVGATLHVHHGRWVEGTAFRVTWLVGGKRIHHSGSSLTLRPSFLGKTVAVRVVGAHTDYASFAVRGTARGKVRH